MDYGRYVQSTVEHGGWRSVTMRSLRNYSVSDSGSKLHTAKKWRLFSLLAGQEMTGLIVFHLFIQHANNMTHAAET